MLGLAIRPRCAPVVRRGGLLFWEKCRKEKGCNIQDPLLEKVNLSLGRLINASCTSTSASCSATSTTCSGSEGKGKVQQRKCGILLDTVEKHYGHPVSKQVIQQHHRIPRYRIHGRRYHPYPRKPVSQRLHFSGYLLHEYRRESN